VETIGCVRVSLKSYKRIHDMSNEHYKQTAQRLNAARLQPSRGYPYLELELDLKVMQTAVELA